MLKKQDQKALKKFGLHLKKLREQKEMSVRDVSYNCTIDNSKISKIENGQVNITFTTLLELAKGLGVSANILLDLEE
jgi:transcriptional regulator with XRE-family HTH domain